MGRRQAVRHQVLVLASGGSNPPAPTKCHIGGYYENFQAHS
jgi:hypothetical protein